MAVHLVGWSPTRVSGCSALTPLVWRFWRPGSGCLHGNTPEPCREEGMKGQSSNQGRSRTFGKKTELCEQARDTHTGRIQTQTHAHTHTHIHRCLLHRNLPKSPSQMYTHTHTQTTYTLPSHRVCPHVLFRAWQGPFHPKWSQPL